MFIAYDVGFTRKPELAELDVFMQLLGFEIESPGQRPGRFTQVYVLCNESVPKEIEFFYEDYASEYKESYGGRGEQVCADGCLKTFETEPAYPNLEERLRKIKEKNARTEHEYYRHVATERFKFYETALALRKHYGALIVSNLNN